MRAWAALLALAGLLAVRPAGADLRTYVVDPAHSRVGFQAVSRFMNAEGAFGRFSGEIRLDEGRLDAAAGRLTVEVASLDTGIRMRDDHLRSEDFLAVGRHPQATFVAASAQPEGGRWLVSGQLTIRGVSRPVTVPVTVTPAGTGLRLVGELTLSRKEYGVAYDSFLNPIRDQVRVTFDLLARPE